VLLIILFHFIHKFRANWSFFLIILTFFTSLNTSSFAQTISADITYKQLSTNDYNVILTTYYNCENIPTDLSQEITIESLNCTINFTQALTKTKETEVSEICDNSINLTTCNGGSLLGIKKIEFSGIVSLPSTCDDWKLSWTSCCRESTISNISNPQNLYTETKLNNLGGIINNSVIFTNIPYVYLCADNPSLYNIGLFDVDGDSVVFELATPQSSDNSVYIFESGFQVNEPVSTSGSFTFDSFSGDLCFTPNQTQTSVVTFQIFEYRKGLLIGSYLKDIIIDVSTDCSNQTPLSIDVFDCINKIGFSNLTGGSSVDSLDVNFIAVCPNDMIQFQIEMKDNDIQPVFISTNLDEAIPDANYSLNCYPCENPILTFNWLPSVSDTGLNSFTVFANDNSCPKTSKTSFRFQILVKEITYTGEDLTICSGSNDYSGEARLKAVGGSSFEWFVVSGDPIVEGVNFSCKTCPNPIAKPSITTTYEVVSNLTGCFNKDTITVYVAPDFSYSINTIDTSVCLREKVFFEANVNDLGNYSYNWKSSFFIQNDTNNFITTSNLIDGNYNVISSISNELGCTKTDTIRLAVSPSNSPKLNVNAFPEVFCLLDADSVNLTVDIIDTTFKGCYYRLVMIDNYDFWNGGYLSLYKNEEFVSNYSANSIETTVILKVNNGDSLRFDYKDGNWENENKWCLFNAYDEELHCDGFKPSVGQNVYSHVASCPVLGNTYYHFEWEPTTSFSQPNAETPNVLPTSNTTYIVTVTDAIGGCFSVGEVTVSVTTNPLDAKITSNSYTCISNSFDTLQAVDKFGIWSGVGITDSILGVFSPSVAGLGEQLIYHRIEGFCGSYDSIFIYVVDTLAPMLMNQSPYCNNYGVDTLFSSNPYGNWQGNGFIDNENGVINTQLMIPGITFITYTSLGCLISYLDSIEIIPIKNPTILSENQICLPSDDIFLETVDTGGIWFGFGITDSILGILSPSLLDTGNYLISYEISGLCGVKDSIILNVSDRIIATIDSLPYLCENSPIVQLTAANIGGVWSMAFNNAFIDSLSGEFNPSLAGIGTHQITYQTLGLCGEKYSTTIKINQGPIATLDVSDETCEDRSNGKITLFVNAGEPPYAYIWNTGDTISEIAGLEPNDYFVTITDSMGCVASENATIMKSFELCEDPSVFIPNIFSPNGDGENDVLYVIGRNISQLEFLIFNRWGEKVFESNNLETGWDGTHRGSPQNSGVYVYSIKATLRNGSIEELKGTITLVK
jgi:gliding motility-associated-like protein